MSDNHIRDERLEREMGEQDDPTLTSVSRPGGVAGGIEASRRQPLQRPRPLLAESCSRSGGELRKNGTGPNGLRSTLVARTTWTGARRFSVLGTAVVLCGFAFLALFSTSGAEKRVQERRTKPSLGRPESAAQQAGRPGSTIPLLNADQGAGDQNSEQLSPDDILATSRRAQMGNQQPPDKDARRACAKPSAPRQ